MAELERCPSCDGKAGVYLRYDLPPKFSVACSKCGFEMAFSYESYDYAVEQWNRRAFLDLWGKRSPDSPGDHMVLEGSDRDG